MRTYGAVLPSSLATVLSLTFVFSTRPPVSVLVRAWQIHRLEAFLGSRSHVLRYSPKVSLPLRALSYGTGFPWYPTASLGPQSIQRVTLSVSVAPSPDLPGCRNIRLLSIRCAFRPRVRSRLTQGGRTFPWNPWAFGVQDSHLHLATHTGILASMLSICPRGHTSATMQRSPTT